MYMTNAEITARAIHFVHVCYLYGYSAGFTVTFLTSTYYYHTYSLSQSIQAHATCAQFAI